MSDVVRIARLPVEVRPGMFERERSVSFSAEDRKYSLFVDQRDVVDNKIEVSIVTMDRGRGMALIDLPNDTSISGNRVYVPISILDLDRQPARL